MSFVLFLLFCVFPNNVPILKNQRLAWVRFHRVHKNIHLKKFVPCCKTLLENPFVVENLKLLVLTDSHSIKRGSVKF